MKNKLAAVLIALFITLLPFSAALAADNSGGICVLYTNDVHCAVDDYIGYAGLAGYKAEMEKAYGKDHVTLVDAGDAVQGASIGALSRGESIIKLMNEVGYDVVTPGNHEFDYGMDRMLELMAMHQAAVVSCNFKSLETGDTVFAPYAIIDYGAVQIAYVGITTPKSFTSSTPRYFQDDAGAYIYGFCEDSSGEVLYAAVQESVDQAVAAGADYVFAVGHCGVDPSCEPWLSTDIIAHTTGIDVFIDAHSHSTIAGETCWNEQGEKVVLTSTGAQLAAIGKLVISPEGLITTELVTGYTGKDKRIDALVKSIQAENEKLLQNVVARSEVDLVINDPATGSRLVRNSETNLGDLTTDAYRKLLEADIGVLNGGVIRNGIAAGDITYNDILSVLPFGNMACVVEADGQEILDLLEMGAHSVPAEFGGFIHASGLTYEIHSYIKSSLALDDKGSFAGVGGPYRVHNVKVGGRPLDLDRTYTMASHNYLIKNGGDGSVMFMDNTLVKDEVMPEDQVLLNYIVEKLGGVVGAEYADPKGQGRIALVAAPPFADVAPEAWYFDGVVYADSEGIMQGASERVFAPNSPLTRAMFVTMLYNQAGSPEVDGQVSGRFSDCPDGRWYSDAVLWAAQKGIAQGVTASLFRPDAPLTRQEMASFLYRYLQSGGGGFKGMWMFRLDYADTANIADWAYEAVAYCSMNDLINGTGSGRYAPDSIATRAMGAVVMQNYNAGGH